MHFTLGSAITLEQLSVDPYPLFHRLREREPVTFAPALGQWLITSRDLAMDVLRDHARFRTDASRSPIRDTFGEQMLSSEGETQRRFKSACAPPFNARAVEETRPLVASIAERHVTTLAAQRAGVPGSPRVFDLRASYAAPIALETVARVIGLLPDLDPLLREWYDTFAQALMNYEREGDTRVRAHQAVRAFREAISPRLAARDEGGRTLLGALANGAPRQLNDEEIGSNALIVLFGGIETTEASISNAIWALLNHPSAMERARADEDDLALCIEESLRWEPAVQTCTRYAAVECEVGGVRVPEGALVQCMIGAMNRDPAHYRDPDTYDPWRADSTPHAAFGFGRHYCLGAALARLEACEGIGQLLARFPSITLDRERTLAPRGHEFRKPAVLSVLAC
ncbi:MAG: cytochrome P450 [Gemmatimonadaceae bacterium]